MLFEDPFLRLRLALILALLLGAVGTVGYMVIELFGLLDAIYMTVITLSTVGYGTVHPLSPHGKVFTIGLIAVGILTATWVISTVVEVFVSEQALRIRELRSMEKSIEKLHEHVVVCGYGRIGRQIAVEYVRNRVPFVVVDLDVDRVETLRAHGHIYVEGDASDEEALTRAGIHRAAALIAVTTSDAVNTFIVLTARGMRANLFIIARADSPQNVEKLYRAGASKVVSPHVLGGRWMGATAINPAVTDFISAMTDMDHEVMQMREVTIVEESGLTGKRFGDVRLREATGALVVAVRSGVGHDFVANPPDDYRCQPGDALVALGSPAQLTKLCALVDPSKPYRPLVASRSA